MNRQPRITIHLDAHHRVYRPGDVLSGHYVVESVERDEIEGLELSVLWFTEGKGDEDLGVHLFKRFSNSEGDAIAPGVSGSFSTQLPPSPLSYDGVLLKIRWCVRIRLFLRGGRQVVEDEPFELGELRTAEVVET